MPATRRLLCHLALLLAAASCLDRGERSTPKADAAVDAEVAAPAEMSTTRVDAGDNAADAAAQGGRRAPGESSTMIGTPPGAGGRAAEPADAGAADSGSVDTPPPTADPCDPSPCQNGGRCSGEGQCDCSGTGFTGTRCQTEIDECVPQPCLNGGECTDQLRGYRCACSEGWQGPRCETSSRCSAEDKSVCASGDYCNFDILDACGTEGQRGTCKPIPATCLLVDMRVCGCDGMTYDNACYAAMRGVSVAMEGECPSSKPAPAPMPSPSPSPTPKP
jgi:hypothetical protein